MISPKTYYIIVDAEHSNPQLPLDLGFGRLENLMQATHPYLHSQSITISSIEFCSQTYHIFLSQFPILHNKKVALITIQNRCYRLLPPPKFIL